MIKKISLLTMVICTMLAFRAQTTIIDLVDSSNHQLNRDDGSLYLKDINDLMIPFIGTWKWTDGNREFILTLIKQTQHHYNSPFDYYKDRIVGYYIYKENGIIIADTSSDDLNEDFTPRVHFSLDSEGKICSFQFKDYLKNKDYDVWLELVSSSQIRLHGSEPIYETIKVKDQPEILPPILAGNTFPLEMTLTKQ